MTAERIGAETVKAQPPCARCGSDLGLHAINLADIGLDAEFCGKCAHALRNPRNWLDPIPDGATCEHCGEHEAAVIWSENGLHGLNHGGSFEYWCNCCCKRASLEHAERELAALPGRIAQLKRELGKACGALS